MNLMTPILVMLALGFAPDETKKPTETVIYKGAIIHTANAMPIINGYLVVKDGKIIACLLYTSPSPRDRQKSRMPSSA